MQAILVTLKGPDAGRHYPLDTSPTVLGRQVDSTIYLASKAVSRQHAHISIRDKQVFIEDLDSSNGTYLNGQRLLKHHETPLTERDTLQIGPYVFALRVSPMPATTEANLVIREQVSVTKMPSSVYGQDPAQKLQVVLEIAQNLARTLDLEPLLNKLLDQLMRLFPHADRAMVLLCEKERLVVRAQRCRRAEDVSAYPYSRTIVHRALDEGIGILSEDVKGDQRFQASATITSIDVHSLLCVPLIAQDGKRLAVIQLDRFRQGTPFRMDDLQLLTTISLQVAVVLENAAMHAELLGKQRQDQELALAHEIQMGFMPSEFDGFKERGFDLYAVVHSALEVSGDLYDFFARSDGKLAFFVGDVSGKGMPAALFMVSVHTLCRHLATAKDGPAATLTKLNAALAADNASGLFVTLAYGVFDPATGNLTLASAGHPLPLLRRGDGTIEEIELRTGRLLGYDTGEYQIQEIELALKPGELLAFYTDGFTEAREPTQRAMFGIERLKKVVAGFDAALSLSTCVEHAKTAINQFTRTVEQQDDLTMLLLRRLD